MPTCLEFIDVVGATILDHRFWIPRFSSSELPEDGTIARPLTTSHTVILHTQGPAIQRVETLRRCLSLGFIVNKMFILELQPTANVKVSLACQFEPYNFHPRLLRDNNKIDSIAVTFSYAAGSVVTSVELMIISVICRSCGFSRM